MFVYTLSHSSIIRNMHLYQRPLAVHAGFVALMIDLGLGYFQKLEFFLLTPGRDILGFLRHIRKGLAEQPQLYTSSLGSCMKRGLGRLHTPLWRNMRETAIEKHPDQEIQHQGQRSLGPDDPRPTIDQKPGFGSKIRDSTACQGQLRAPFRAPGRFVEQSESSELSRTSIR